MDAVRRRTLNGGALARELSSWSDAPCAHWQQIHFGTPEISDAPNGFRFRVAVYLGEVDQNSVSVELFADGAPAFPPVRIVMSRDGHLEGALNAHVYETTVVADRPASDFTARVVPSHADAVLPAELPLILWQR